MSEPSLDSYSDFIDSLREIDVLLAARPSDQLSSGGTEDHIHERELTNAITRACIVMLVAHFEGFVKSSLTELVDAICQAKPPARRVPEGLLELHTRERIQEIFGTEGQDRIHRTRKLFSTYAQLWDEDRSINPRLISSRILTRQLTNAKPEILESVFTLLDVDDIIKKINNHVNKETSPQGETIERVKADVKLIEIVDRRNKVAHGDKFEKLTPIEIKNYKSFLQDVAECIAQVIRARINHCCSLI